MLIKKFVCAALSVAMLFTAVSGLTAFASEGDIQTEYGTIPAKYANATAYPFAVFFKESNGTTTFKNSYTNWRDAISYASGNVNQTWTASRNAIILLRADGQYGSEGVARSLYDVMGTVTVDLDGHTLYRTTNPLFEAEYKNKSTATTSDLATSTIAVKNGTISMTGHIINLKHSSDSNYTMPHTYNFTFENVTFTSPENTNPGNVLCFCNSGSSIGGTVNMELTDCTFDIRNMHGDTDWTTIFNLRDRKDGVDQKLIDGVVNVYGGTLIANTLEKVTLLNGDSEDSIKFHKNNDEYIKFIAPSEYTNPRELKLPTEEDGSCWFGNPVNDGNNLIYSLTNVKKSEWIAEADGVVTDNGDGTYSKAFDLGAGVADGYNSLIIQKADESLLGASFSFLDIEEELSDIGNSPFGLVIDNLPDASAVKIMFTSVDLNN